MTIKPKIPSGDTSQSSSGSYDGSGDDANERDLEGDDQDDNEGDDADDRNGETVRYSTYSKVLSEKKKYAQRLREIEAENAEFRRQQAEAEEARLKETNDYKTAYEKTKTDVEQYRSKYNDLLGDIVKSRKVNAFQAVLKAQVKPEYHGFIDVDAILVDPETGEVDDMSVAKEVERFQKKHPELVVRQTPAAGGNTPYPRGEGKDGNKIRRSDWLKLPSKEMYKWKHEQIIDD